MVSQIDVNSADLNGKDGLAENVKSTADPSEFSECSVEDLSNNGIDDMLIGAYAANQYAYQPYVAFVSKSSFTSSFDLTSLNGATNGFVINGINPGEDSGSSVAGAGDINGNGIDDAR